MQVFSGVLWSGLAYFREPIAQRKQFIINYSIMSLKGFCDVIR